MAIVSGSTILKLSDDSARSLAHGQIQASPATTAQAVDAAGNVSGPVYTDGIHFARTGSTVQRLAAYPASRQLLKFVYEYDDSPPAFANPFDSPKAALDTFETAVTADTTALGQGRAGIAALTPASVTNIATAVTYLTAEKTALLTEIDSLHQTLGHVRTALETLAGVVVTLRSQLPPTT